ncbi:unnamed protein product [Schistosoma margrebowiei]|uniref:Uncharacterized protein n=1 Tax=Schistosoma margrebowiei TaxID=48269 RepID=A0A183N476_9TREM|nr:unnamed protein product [Schistosoma margrebowiei]
MEDVRTKRGADIASDHHLLVAKMKLELKKYWTTGRTISQRHDLALLSHKQRQMQENSTSVAADSAAVGLNTHKRKSKIFRYNTACSNPVTFDGDHPEHTGVY